MKKILLLLLVSLAGAGAFAAENPKPAAKKLYWFIPDGTRADRGDFDIYRWAREGKLPNIKRMMEEGSYGYSIPDFPSHTPINFASLLTGTHPSAHGIADGPMHVEGAPLDKPSAPGFSSGTKRVPPIWKTMEALGKKVMLLSIPGSTPPEIQETTVRGRWGGWGADTFNMVFESKNLLEKRKQNGRGFRLFFLGAPLTSFVDMKTEENKSFTGRLAAHGLPITAEVLRGKGKAYDRIRFGLSDKQIELKQGKWSEWMPVELEFKGVKFPSSARIKIIKLWANGDFRVRVLYDNLNRLIVEPGTAAEAFRKNVGPMVDHADNWPPQLIFEPEDKNQFLDEMRMSLDWHKRAVPFVYDYFKPDIFIQDTYTPNQMLESRWWMGRIDKGSKHYTAAGAKDAWKDIHEMYKGLDAIVGEAMKKADKDTIVAFSSDHGVCPLHRLVHLNNLFAKKGWLKFTIDEKTGEPVVDWKNTKVIYLKMLHVYISPTGLEGNWKRSSGPEYDKLRNEVIEAIGSVVDPKTGEHPLVKAAKWEEAGKTYDLPMDRIGDLVIEAKRNYFWYEEMSNALDLFSDPLTSGYKQSLDPLANECMWTPFLVWGPGVKKGHKIAAPISHVDQLPTFLKLMDIKIPDQVQGKAVAEAIE